jgi:hypothetical protein
VRTRDRLDPGGAQPRGDAHQLVVRRSVQHRAVLGETFGYADAQRRRHQRLGDHLVEPVQVRAGLPAQSEDVGETLGRQQRGPGTPFLDDRVGGDRAAVIHRRGLAGVRAQDAGQQFG